MKTKHFFFTLAFLIANISINAQKEGLPVVGTQVFIEPGQTNEEVENWFRILHDQKMTVCRVFLVEPHMHKSDGSWDFERYDLAFKMAEKYGIKVFATMYPKEIALDWRLEKLPQSKEHLKLLKEYFKTMVQHFGTFKSLYCWVIQNEPGSNGMYTKSNLSDSLKNEWKKLQVPDAYKSKGYSMDKSMEDNFFLRNYITWYLSLITDQIHETGDKHEIHVNNQNIYYNAPEYDFVAWRKFLSIFGASCHPSWHYTYFNRDQYSMVLSANCDLMRFGAGDKPFMVTELQGGNNTYSGHAPMCPTKDEITQWLWVSIGSGSKGTVFWTLNPRAVGGEAGEWAMIDFQQKPSDRLLAAGAVANDLSKNRTLFENAKPYESNIYILYSKESFWLERTKADRKENALVEGRTDGAMIKSVITWYEALTACGINTNLGEMGEFNWDKPSHVGETIILSHQLSISSIYWEKIRHFVKSGGKLIVDGLTFFFDENHFAVMQTGFPLQDVMGGSLAEVVTTPGDFSLKIGSDNLPAHLFKGLLNNTTGKILAKEGDNVVAITNQFGKGNTTWIPSMLGLGAKRVDNGPLSRFLQTELSETISSFPVRFDKPQKGVQMRTMVSGSDIITIIINKSTEVKTIPLIVKNKNLKPNVLVASKQGTLSGKTISIKPEETMVIQWKESN
ncbi:MAG: beta-galactosidase trimerization domain-containing protein [Paludibacter sp.]